MTASRSSIPYKDYNGASRPVDAADQSNGAGTGPFDPLHGVIDANGNWISPATSANQATANTSLASIDGKTRPTGPVTLTDRSITLTTGGTAQQAVAANASRAFLMISNPSTVEDAIFSLTGTASISAPGSTRLAPGGGVIFDVQVPNGAISVLAATTGHFITVVEG